LEFERERLDGRWLQLQITALGLVRLRDHGGHAKRFVARQRFEAGAGQLRRAHEDDSQRGHHRVSAQRREGQTQETILKFYDLLENVGENLDRQAVGVDAADEFLAVKIEHRLGLQLVSLEWKKPGIAPSALPCVPLPEPGEPNIRMVRYFTAFCV
jgi:hypothetical protein